VYKFDKNMQPVPHKNAVKPLSGIYLEKKGLLRAALDREQELARSIAGFTRQQRQQQHEQKAYYAATLGLLKEEEFESSGAATLNITSSTSSSSTSNSEAHNSLIKSLSKLESERRLFDLIDPTNHLNIPEQTDFNLTDNLNLHPLTPLNTHNNTIGSVNTDTNNTSSSDSSSDDSAAANKWMTVEKLSPTTLQQHPPTFHSPIYSRPINPDDNVLERPLLIIIRHGKTEHNKLGLFTGWEDANLAHDGREEALHAGRVLHQYDIKFDVVYTSWLSRAIETAWLVMNELNSLWLPIVKTWRLNERMYGALTGLSKKMIRQIYGDEQFMRWRRGYDHPPPEISSFSHAYPGNDDRYVNYVQDVEVSLFETCIRSLAHGKFELHRKFPKAESLKDCMDRTIPYFKNVIVPDSVAAGKNVLIASSENAIRGLLMHLCGIPIDQIHCVEIPTGLPLVFDSRLKGIRLLDDGRNTAVNGPLLRYNFGSNPELLFKRNLPDHELAQQKDSTPYELCNDDILIRRKETLW